VKARIEEWLHQGEYDAAYEALIAVAERPLPPRAAAAALLDLAEFYSLYAEAEAEPWAAALEEAHARWRAVGKQPLYQALAYELAALHGEKRELPELRDARSRYHLAQGSAYLGRHEEALALLEGLEPLPVFLQSRVHALRGRLLEALGDVAGAADEHYAAAQNSLGKERLWSLLDAAALRLDAQRGVEAAAALAEAEPLLAVGELSDRATYHYLRARAELLLGNPELAAQQVVQAEGLEAAGAGLSHGTAMVRAQVHQQLGQLEQARAAYREAVARASDAEQPFIWHEWGVAELDAGQLLEAESLLARSAASEAYPYRAQALADLAEVHYRLGNGPRAEETALAALTLLPTPAAHIVLGNRAYDVGHWSEALAHYRAAAALAREGERDWVTATEMIVDVLAQMGYPNPAEVADLAERVLPFLPPSDEWRETLHGYAAHARKLAAKNRTLN